MIGFDYNNNNIVTIISDKGDKLRLLILIDLNFNSHFTVMTEFTLNTRNFWKMLLIVKQANVEWGQMGECSSFLQIHEVKGYFLSWPLMGWFQYSGDER